MDKAAMPEGKYLASVKLGPKGQIVVPKEVREMFGVRPGDTLLPVSYTHLTLPTKA